MIHRRASARDQHAVALGTTPDGFLVRRRGFHAVQASRAARSVHDELAVSPQLPLSLQVVHAGTLRRATAQIENIEHVFDTWWVGSNRRYADYFDALMDERILASLAAKGGLQCLSDKELDLAREALTIDPEPKPVVAWVRFYGVPVLVRGHAHRWTSRAIGIRFKAGDSELATWVWANAVAPDDGYRPPLEEEKNGRSVAAPR